MDPYLFHLLGQTQASNPSLTALGHLGRALIAFAGIAAIAAFIAALRKNEKWATKALWISSGSFGLAFLSLLTLFVNSQFQFRYVQRHSALDHELQYKVAGVWSGQEGSFLLWAICSALFVSLAIRKADGYKAWFAGVSSLFLAALAGILSFESPFVLNPAGTDISDGFGLAPSLLNYWVVIHPPTIFLGFGCLTALFAWSMAAMLHRDLDTWIDQVRPWVMVGLTFTGVGLCMGGFWAYETLNWGGFWAWDPVENTSFVPWIFLAVFVHGIIVQKARRKGHIANIVYGAAPFLSFVYGTFLTRSGFLGETSVHSFAQMDRSALWILVALGTVAFAGFIGTLIPAIKWWKAHAPASPANEGFWTKETLYGYGNWLLISLAVIAAFGMSVPLIQSLRGLQPSVVEEKLYNTVSAFPFIPIMLLMGIAPFLTWRKEGIRNFNAYFIPILSAAIATTGFLLIWLKWGGHEVAFGNQIVKFSGLAASQTKTTDLFLNQPVYSVPWILCLFFICAFAFYANVTRGIQLLRKNKLSAASMLTHIGVILAITGLIVSRGLEQKVTDTSVHQSKVTKAFGYDITLLDRTSGFDDRNNKIRLNFKKEGDNFIAEPGLYFMMGQDGAPTATTWPYIHSSFLHDIYIVLYPFQFDEDFIPDFGGSNATTLLPGQTGVFFETFATYHGMETEGTPGMAGAKFTAVLSITDRTGERTVRPYVELKGPGELDRPVVDIGNGLGVYVESINAADQSATIVFRYLTPAYPIEVYYKPLTILVWWGVGIMALGGTLAAIYRRNKRIAPSSSNPENGSPEEQTTKETDATENLVEV